VRAPSGLTGAYAALAAVDTVLAGRGARPWRRATKPLLMPALAAGLAASSSLGDRAVRRTVVAQALSWGGDVALMAPGRWPFLAGLGSFLGAHLAYVGAFRALPAEPLLGSPARRAALAGGAGLAAGMGVAARRNDRRLAGPVVAYGLVLTTMAVTSATLPAGPGRRRVLAGTSLFLLSDSLLGAGRFLLDDAPPALDAAVMATYTAGQWCIAAGIRELPTASQGG